MPAKGKFDSPMTGGYPAPNPGKHLGLPMEPKPTGKIDQHNVHPMERQPKPPMDSPLENTFKPKR